MFRIIMSVDHANIHNNPSIFKLYPVFRNKLRLRFWSVVYKMAVVSPFHCPDCPTLDGIKGSVDPDLHHLSHGCGLVQEYIPQMIYVDSAEFGKHTVRYAPIWVVEELTDLSTEFLFGELQSNSPILCK